MKPKNQVLDNFSVKIPSGAKVIGIGGSGDVYLRSVFAFYRI
jgi:ABC-type multidrug transport system fused ATPase/permease subunit